MPHRVLSRQSSLDRFIRRTSSIHFEHSSEDKAPVCSSNFKNMAKERCLKENYRKALRNALLLDPCIHNDIFNQEMFIFKTPTINHWPVYPRKEAVLPSEPEMVLDMPDLPTELWKNPVDWGSNGYIATTFRGAVYFWSPKKKSGFTYADLKVKHCIKWNRTSTQLGLSIAHGSRLAILDFCQNNKQKVPITTICCSCNISNIVPMRKECEMCCIEWTSKNCLISGCSSGSISYWSDELKMLNYRIRAHGSHIIKMSLSCKESYLITIGRDNVVMVWIFPWLEALLEIKFELAPSKAVAWHPWRENLLAFGDFMNLSIINVESQKVFVSHVEERLIINNLTFNPRSGELLICLYDYHDGASFLRVMRNLDTVVDEIRCNEDKILDLLWDSTGTKLGTVSTDENFSIWSFFGKSTELEKKYLNKQRKIFSTCPLIKNFSHTIR